MKTLIFIILNLVMLSSLKAQIIDSLSFDDNTHLMMSKSEFEKIANPDTCLIDMSGNYSFLIFKRITYYGISKKELAKIQAQKIKLINCRTIESIFLFNPQSNTFCGYKKRFIIGNITLLTDEEKSLLVTK